MSIRMKGLNQFISDIRNCPNKESETKRVDKEMAKIRNKFTSQKAMDGYQKKKYVWKLMYMLILGYDVDFGHMEAANLINSPKFSEKYTGYVATGMMVNESNDLYKLVSNSIKNDLLGHNEVYQSLALAMIGTVAPKELVESMYNDVAKMALFETSRVSMFVRKKAILCLLRIYRKFKEKFNTGDGWGPAIAQMLEQRNSGFLSSACSLLIGIITLQGSAGFEMCVSRVIKILQKFVLHRDCTQDYLYYGTPNPWLQVKCLKLLQYFSPPENDGSINVLIDILRTILTKTEVTKSMNKNNADYGILFEAVNVIISYRYVVGTELRNQAISLLGVFITVKEPNIRYLALEAISKFSQTPNSEGLIQEHLKTILVSLRDNDVSIRRRALDILYIMCTQATASKIVDELLNYSDEPDLTIKEELVLKIAILAEKFANDLIWYIDVVVRLVSSSGDYITDDIWYRIIQMVTGFGKETNPELQKYAANKLLFALNVPTVHENLVKIGSYILAEYGELISNHPNKDPFKIFEVLNRHFSNCSNSGKAMLMNAYAKLGNRFPELIDMIVPIFEIHSEHWDPDLQQRALEYLKLLQDDKSMSGVRSVILQKMPCFSDEIQTNNPLLKRIYALKMGVNSKDPTVVNEAKKAAEEEMYKTRSFMTNNQLAQSLQTLGQKENANQYATTSTNNTKKLAAEENLLGNDLSTSTMGPSGIRSHPLYNVSKPKLAEGNNCIQIPERLKVSQANLTEMKALISTPDGVLYNDNNLQIEYKSSYQAPLGKIALQFVSKGAPLSKVIINVPSTQSLFFNISPIKYGDHPQVMLQVINIGYSTNLPKANLNFYQGDAYRNIEFELPVTVNKFINPVDMPLDKFSQFFEEYTHAQNDKYFRIDNFINNPAPPHVPVSEVLKKVSALLTNGLNFNAKYYPDSNNIKEICATGNYTYKPEGAQNNTNLPLIANVEAYSEDTRYLRLSLRGAGTGEVIKGIYQIMIMYLNPQQNIQS